jgi:hypothetical protein
VIVNRRQYIALVFFGLFVAALHAQDLSLEEGYGKVRWGASPEEVKMAYKYKSESGGDSDLYDEFHLFSEEDGPIKSRRFTFGNGKLYMVYVVYKQVQSETVMALLRQMVNKYGDYSITKENDRVAFTFWFDAKGSQVIDFLRFKSRDGLLDLVTITYQNPSMLRQIESESIRF